MDLFQIAMLVAPVVATVRLATTTHNAGRAALWSTVAGGAAAASFIGYTIFHLGRPTPPLPAASVLLIGMAIISGTLGWAICRVHLIFRSEQPWVAVRPLVLSLLRWSLKIAASLVVAFVLTQAVLIDLHDEPAEIVYYRLQHNLHWLSLYGATAFLIVLVWSYAHTRPKNSSHTATWRLALFGVAPPAIAGALLLPIVVAWVEALLSAPMLDCTPTNIPGHFPDMVDYSRLIFDSLARGAMLGLGQLFGFSLTKCVADSSNSIAVWLVWVLRLLPGCIFLWLSLRRYHLGM